MIDLTGAEQDDIHSAWMIYTNDYETKDRFVCVWDELLCDYCTAGGSSYTVSRHIAASLNINYVSVNGKILDYVLAESLLNRSIGNLQKIVSPQLCDWLINSILDATMTSQVLRLNNLVTICITPLTGFTVPFVNPSLLLRSAIYESSREVKRQLHSWSSRCQSK